MSDEDEEKYTYFGNNLDPLEEGDMTKRKPTPIEDQVATDKQGRRRFHGAFTGGFSAGFYNSVGSSEGWTPSTFQSSRAEKSEKRHQKPQDFMDDEDQEEFGIAPRVLRARQEYGATRPVLTSTSDLSSAVENVLRPVKERVGEKLLKQMGWRHGQGVGPRLTKTDKKIQQKRLHEETSDNNELEEGEIVEDHQDTSVKRQKMTPAQKDFDFEKFRNRWNPKSDQINSKFSNLQPKSEPRYEDRGSKTSSTTSSEPIKVTSNITEIVGDLFSAPVNVSLAHCVGKDLAMSAGIARQFKSKFGQTYFLQDQKKEVGEIAVLKYSKRCIFYLVTKNSSYDHSPKIQDLWKCIENLLPLCQELGVTELAIPRISAGLDHIPWPTVLQMIVNVFENSKIQITIYRLPDEPTPPLQLSSNVTEIVGDLFSTSRYTSLAHCVCENFVMNQGVSRKFKMQFGSVSELLAQQKKVGEVAFLKFQQRHIFYLVVKKSVYETTNMYLESCLKNLLKSCQDLSITELAMPRIGCGRNLSDWDKVLSMIIQIFQGSRIRVKIYRFPEVPASKIPERNSVQPSSQDYIINHPVPYLFPPDFSINPFSIPPPGYSVPSFIENQSQNQLCYPGYQQSTHLEIQQSMVQAQQKTPNLQESARMRDSQPLNTPEKQQLSFPGYQQSFSLENQQTLEQQKTPKLQKSARMQPFQPVNIPEKQQLSYPGYHQSIRLEIQQSKVQAQQKTPNLQEPARMRGSQPLNTPEKQHLTYPEFQQSTRLESQQTLEQQKTPKLQESTRMQPFQPLNTPENQQLTYPGYQHSTAQAQQKTLLESLCATVQPYFFDKIPESHQRKKSSTPVSSIPLPDLINTSSSSELSQETREVESDYVYDSGLSPTYSPLSPSYSPLSPSYSPSSPTYSPDFDHNSLDSDDKSSDFDDKFTKKLDVENSNILEKTIKRTAVISEKTSKKSQIDTRTTLIGEKHLTDRKSVPTVDQVPVKLAVETISMTLPNETNKRTNNSSDNITNSGNQNSELKQNENIQQPTKKVKLSYAEYLKSRMIKKSENDGDTVCKVGTVALKTDQTQNVEDLKSEMPTENDSKIGSDATEIVSEPLKAQNVKSSKKPENEDKIVSNATEIFSEPLKSQNVDTSIKFGNEDKISSKSETSVLEPIKTVPKAIIPVPELMQTVPYPIETVPKPVKCIPDRMTTVHKPVETVSKPIKSQKSTQIISKIDKSKNPMEKLDEVRSKPYSVVGKRLPTKQLKCELKEKKQREGTIQESKQELKKATILKRESKEMKKAENKKIKAEKEKRKAEKKVLREQKKLVKENKKFAKQQKILAKEKLNIMKEQMKQSKEQKKQSKEKMKIVKEKLKEFRKSKNSSEKEFQEKQNSNNDEDIVHIEKINFSNSKCENEDDSYEETIEITTENTEYVEPIVVVPILEERNVMEISIGNVNEERRVIAISTGNITDELTEERTVMQISPEKMEKRKVVDISKRNSTKYVTQVKEERNVSYENVEQMEEERNVSYGNVELLNEERNVSYGNVTQVKEERNVSYGNVQQMEEERNVSYGNVEQIKEERTVVKLSTENLNEHSKIEENVDEERFIFISKQEEPKGPKVKKSICVRKDSLHHSKDSIGIVSRKSKSSKKYHDSQKVYGCARGPVPEAPKDSDSSGEDDENTYAPDDLPPCLVQPKTNTFGMGYSGLDRNPVLSGHVNLFEPQTMNLPTGSKRGIRGQAFGVGAFEAEDEDIYGGDDMSRYDFSLESAAERKHRLQQERLNKAKKAVLGSKDCLEGFKKATGQRLTMKAFPAPVLPKDYKPQHVVKQSKFSTPTVAPSEHTKLGLGRHDMTAEERSILLGEASSKTSKPSTEVPIPSQLTPISISGTQNSASVPVPSQYSTGTLNVVAAELSEGQFKPFADKEQKQLRYRQFLTLLKDGRKDDLALLQPSSMTEWEKGRELREFEQASKLFKPLSGPISERFVSSATLIGHEEAPTIDTKPKIDADVSAAKMKMFGKLTRSREPWQPHSLVCKRFNVPEPNSGAPVMKKKRPGFSVFDFLSAAPQNTMGENSQNYASTSSKELPAAGSGDSVVPQNERLTESTEQDDPLMEQDFPEDPADKVDLYKAIFLSSSEDEAEPEPQNSSLQTTSKPSALPTTVPREKTSRFSDPTLPDPEPQNTKRNLSPARGVFANIDLVVPSTPKPTDPPPSTDLSPDSYGPALPSSVVPSVVPSVPESVKTLNFPPSNLEWTEKTKKSSSSKKRSSSSSSSKKRKHKKEKKSKKSKKKKKESKSSRKRKYSSSSSSSSSSD